MSKGGRRPGAGRKPGSANRRTREIADRAAAIGITPLEFLLNVMRDEACPKDADLAQKIAFHTLRFEAAKAAAPYLHPRLSQREEPVTIEPLTGTLSEQASKVLAAIAAGSVTPSQGATVLQALSTHANIIKIDDLVRRVTVLEESNLISNPKGDTHGTKSRTPH